MTESGEVARARDQGRAARVPDGVAGGPWWWARRRGLALDAALGAASSVECAFEGWKFAGETGVPVPLAVLLGVMVGAVLVLRRRWPIVVVLVAIAVTPAEMGLLLSTVGLYTLAASDVPRRIIVLLAGMMVTGGLIITYIRMHQEVGHDPGFNPPVWFIPLVSVLMSVGLTVPPLLLGLYVGARRRLVESLRERADGLERELSLLADRAEERAEWARNEERTRIAREMHDVVAHRVSLMVVHAAALQAVALKDPEKASRNAALVGDMGRQALTELRTMLGVLRTADGGVSGVSDAAAEARRSADSGPERGSESGSESRPGATSREAGGQQDAPAPLAAFAASASASASGPGPGSADSGSGSGTVSGAESGAARGPGSGSGSGSDSGSAGAAYGAGNGRGAIPGANGAGTGGGPAAGAPDDDSRDGMGGPTLDGLDDLVGQSRQAGMSVELLVEGEWRGYAARVEQTAYRVVQEALTNVHKHAAGARTRVRLAHRAGEVALQVENEPPAEGVASAGLPSGGNGLVGMRERVAALGGAFVSGPTDAGGFRVSAVIPGDA